MPIAELVYFEGAHFAHIVTRDEAARRDRLAADAAAFRRRLAA